MSSSNPKNIRRLVPGILISALSLAIIFYFVDLERLWQALRQADMRMIIALLGITLLWLAVRTTVWRTLLQEQATFGQTFMTLNEGYLLNNILPFRLGEVGRAFILGKKAGLGFFHVFSTILIERALDVIMAAALLMATLPFVIQASFAWQTALATGGLVCAGLVCLYLLARNQGWAMAQYERLAGRTPKLKRLLGQQQVLSFFAGLAALVDGKRFIKVVLLMFLNWGIALVQFFVLLRAYFPSAQPLWSAFTLAVMSLGIAAPSSPGAVGVLEISIMGALSAFDLDASTALAAALTAHLMNYATTSLIGGYALLRDGLTLTGLYRDVRDIPAAEKSKME